MSIGINRGLEIQWFAQNLSPAGTPAKHCCPPDNIFTPFAKQNNLSRRELRANKNNLISLTLTFGK